MAKIDGNMARFYSNIDKKSSKNLRKVASGINIGLSMTLSFCEPCRTMKISSETEIGLEDKNVLLIRTLR